MEMIKQEEIDRILTRYTGRTGIHLDVVKRELSKAGVVIKVDRELPENPYTFEEPTYTITQMIDGWMHKGYEKAQEDMAGYVAVEPLILEEVTTGGVSANPPLVDEEPLIKEGNG